jgi:hypothetical protein
MRHTTTALRGGLQIAVLLRLGVVAAADADRRDIFSEAEADRDQVRRVVPSPWSAAPLGIRYASRLDLVEPRTAA